jgi:hypothetical protein
VLALWPLLLALASPDAGDSAADKSPATALERRACEQQMRALAKSMGSGERPSAKDVKSCAASLRKVRAGYGMDEAQYTRWLRCQAETWGGFGGPCDKILSEVGARKAVDQIDAMLDEDKRHERAALAALAPFRDKGFISADNYREVESASQDDKHGSMSELLEDAVRLLKEGRVRPGTELAIYPHEGIGLQGAPAPQTGERAADLAFVDARNGRRIVRFAHTSVVELIYRIDNGELPSALDWVGEKPEARDIEVTIFTSESFPARVLLDPKTLKDMSSKLAAHLPGALAQRPFLIQGKTRVSYERWLALAARFHERGFDGNKADWRTLSKLVTLADLEKVLR